MAQHCSYIHRLHTGTILGYIAELNVYDLNSSVGRASYLGFDSQFWSKRFCYNAYSFSAGKFANNKE